jgi:hypothetical protein
MLSEEEVRDSIESWGERQVEANSDEHRLAVDLVLRALLRRVSQDDRDQQLEELRSAVDQRLLANPLLAPESTLRSLGSVDDVIKQIRDSINMGL